MRVEFIIIGQGISGTFLSYYLSKEKRSFLVVDDNNRKSPSRIAAGIINPVTGRRMVTVWMAEQVLPFAWNAYQEIGNDLNINAISQKNMVDFFPNPFLRESFLKRLAEGNEYIKEINHDQHFATYFNYEFGCGAISPVYIAHLEVLLPAWRKRLIGQKLLTEQTFDVSKLVFDSNGVQWSDRDGQTMKADKIIFCDGAGSFDSSLFKQLPFAPNKGEALMAEIPGLPAVHLYKKSMLIVPLETKDLFWIGSNYLWDFHDTDPTDEFRKTTEKVLREWLKTPFKIVDHVAGVRPATVERRPFIGMHPQYPQAGIINGMGTKGCSLAPFFAKQLADHLIHNGHILPEADVNRFKKILSGRIS